MQITLSPVLGGTDLAAIGGLSADVYLPELTEGESFEARVIFSDHGIAHLKTAGGSLIRARLDEGVTLREGTTVRLIVAEKGGALIQLSLGENLSGDHVPGAVSPTGHMRLLPPALTALVEQLHNSSLTVPQRLEAFMRALGDFPTLSLDAAPVRQAAVLLMAEGAKILPAIDISADEAPGIPPRPALGQMLQQLSALLNMEVSSPAQTIPLLRGAPVPGVLTPLFELFLPHPQGAAEVVSGQLAVDSVEKQVAQQPQLPPATRRELLELTQRLVSELFPAGADKPALKELGAFVERLFTSTAPGKKGVENLRQNARELEVRLELLQEVLKRSSLPQREELLHQANRLLQHQEALREERPLCLQLPIHLGEQRQTAELYVYRREKGSSKLDPRNATVLLALNTEHLGRLEALIQVQQKDIYLKLEISRAKAVAFVKEQSGALMQMLAGAGYRLAFATVGQLTRQTQPETAQMALEEFRQGFGHQVDVEV